MQHSSLFAAMVVALAVVTPAAAQTGVIKGQASYRERIALLPGAVFEATLEDVSRADANATVLGTARVDGAGAIPIRFEIAYDPQKIDPRMSYAVRGRIVSADGRLMFTTVRAYPVLTRGAGSEVDLLLVRAGSGGPAPQAPTTPTASGGGNVAPAPSSQSAPAPQEDLATQLANPIANLISVPLQNNWDFSIGPDELDWNAARYTVNIQPVIPFSMGENWNLVTRTIMPVVAAGSPGPDIEGAAGFGDIVQSFFFSPKEPVGGWILGAGPAMLYATASDRLLGAGQWGVGPTAVGLQQKGALTYGALVNHLWTYAGDDDRDEVNATFMNPFFSYITPKKTTYTISPEISYDWTNEQWIAPINFVVSQLMMAGRQPYSIGGGLRFYMDTPTGGPAWGIRFTFTMLFPK